MKKLCALVLTAAMLLSFAACAKKDTSKDTKATEAEQSQAAADDKDNGDAGKAADAGVEFAQKGGKIVFTVDSKLALLQDAWLGFCPGTKGFTKEGDADEVDVLYAYIANGDKADGDNYLFEFENDQIDGLDDGDYVMVLCDSDDESVGKVLLYIPAKISGSNVTLDYDKIVVNK